MRYLFICLGILFTIFISASAENTRNIYLSNGRSLLVYGSNFELIDKSNKVIDSFTVSPSVIKDCATDPEHKHLFAIIGRKEAARGQRLAAFSLGDSKIGKLWIEEDYGFNPWKILVKDVDGDSKIEICVGVWKKATLHPAYANRLFIYGWDGERTFPKWLGSRLSRPFTDFDFRDIDNDGELELIAIEKQRNGLKRIMSYKWVSFGFEGYRILNKDLKEAVL